MRSCADALRTGPLIRHMHLPMPARGGALTGGWCQATMTQGVLVRSTRARSFSSQLSCCAPMVDLRRRAGLSPSPGAPQPYPGHRVSCFCLRRKCYVAAAHRELPGSQAVLLCQVVSSAALRRLWTWEMRTMPRPESHGSPQATHRGSLFRPQCLRHVADIVRSAWTWQLLEWACSQVTPA